MFTRVAAVAVLIGGLAAPLLAQESAEVQFETGNYGTMVEGSITGQAYFDHTLRAGAGQEMFVDLAVTDTDGNGSINFNILPPGSDDVAIFIGSVEGSTARIELPEDGLYTIRTYLMGNDEDTGKRVDYRLDISIQ